MPFSKAESITPHKSKTRTNEAIKNSFQKNLPHRTIEEEDESSAIIRDLYSQSCPLNRPLAFELKSFPQSIPRAASHQHPENVALNPNGFLNMTGTLKHGKSTQIMNLRVHLSREELDTIERTITTTKSFPSKGCIMGLNHGPHVFLFTLLLLPIIFISAATYSFYLGTMTWYNILVFYTEKKSIAHRIFVSPCVIISYPFLITLSIMGHGFYVAFAQISWYYSCWRQKVLDWEKGFYGWLCNFLRLEECSPYQVVVLTEVIQTDTTI